MSKETINHQEVHIKKSNLLLMFFVLFSSISFAGKKNKGKKSPLSKGSKAKYVSLNSLMNLSFYDATLGTQYMFADRQGINVDLGFNSKSTEAGGKIRKISAFSVFFGYINYPFQKGNVAIYLLPYVRVSIEKNASVSTEKNGLELGLGIGSEWWAFKNVNLAAQDSFGFKSETIKNITSNIESKNLTVGFLSNGTGKFYLTFYF